MAKKSTKVNVNSEATQFKKGHEKLGGREKGSLNKKTLIFLDDLGNFKPVDELKKLYKATKDDNIKFAILKEFLKYMYPQRKAVEATIRDNNNSMAEFMQGLKEVAE